MGWIWFPAAQCSNNQRKTMESSDWGKNTRCTSCWYLDRIEFYKAAALYPLRMYPHTCTNHRLACIVERCGSTSRNDTKKSCHGRVRQIRCHNVYTRSMST